MIITKDLITEVFFGAGNKASISVSSKYDVLTLQMLSTDKNIGDRLEESDIKELPKIDMNFFSPNSIDVIIAHLEFIKRNITPPPPESCDQLCLAC